MRSGELMRNGGTPAVVRYHADNPRVAVREEDLGGGGTALLAAFSGGMALLFLLMSVVGLVQKLPQRRD
ncbi:hypothetical protein ACFYVL_01065 [Streptomyces sp. NPDC004111]|uniref:hypothetical protein n=1 Tax=Streptomyces sp. NPDC004111 TaxID=3364690 RepID=UPI00367A2672